MSFLPGSFHRTLAIVALTALMSIGSVAGQDKTVAAQIDQLLARSFPADAPGAAVLVAHRGEILLRKGYGSAQLELGVPVQPEHVFRLGSVTKQFTAVAILQLVEAGKIKLSDDITTYVPEVETGGNKITLTHLLTHTSGLPSYTDQREFHEGTRLDVTLAQTLAWIKGKPAHFAPGTDWRYCNTGYRLLGAVIEKVSGQSYAAYVEEHIFQPTGMSHSSYDDPARVIPQRIPGYSGGAGGKAANAPFVSMTQPHAAGALLSNVDDLWKWDQALAAGRLVRADLLAQAHTSARLADGRAAGYGFGWSIGRIAGQRTFEHGGGIQGFSTYTLSAPDAGLYLAILCNSDRPRAAPGALAAQIAKLVLGSPPEPTPFAVSTEALRTLAGVYRPANGPKIGFTLAGDRLVFQAPGGRTTPLVAVSATEFVSAGDDGRYTFETQGAVPRVRFQPRAGPERVALRVDEPLEEAAAPAVSVPAATLDTYVGDYELAPNFVLSVKRAGDALTAQATGQPQTNLVAENPRRFRVRQVPATIEFKLDEAGNVTGLVLFQNGRELPGKRLK